MRAISLLAVVAVAAASGVRGVEAQTAGPDRLVLAFYETNYGIPGYSEEWMGWDEGGRNPAEADREGRPDIAAPHRPLELYDSFAPGTIERHLRQAERSGIDAFIVAWRGRDDRSNRVLDRCLFIAEKQEAPVRFAASCERVDPPTVNRAVADIEHVLTVHGIRAQYLRAGGRPVVFVSRHALDQLSVDNWRRVVEQIRARQEVFLMAAGADAVYGGIFDGLYEPSIAPIVTEGLDPSRAHGRLVRSARRLGQVACVSVLPGYDDSNIGIPEPRVLPRKGGQTYRDLWESAIAARPDWVAVTSWNHWREGTEIEPSVEEGEAALALTAEMADQFRKAEYPPLAAPPMIDIATLVMGAVNAATRLWQVEWTGARTRADVILETSCRRLLPAGDDAPRTIAFDVEDGFDVSRGARIFTYYFDAKPGRFHIEYDADRPQDPMGGAYRRGIACTLTGDGHWKEMMFMLPDAAFQGRQEGMADFRFVLTEGEAAFHRVSVQTPPIHKPPEPTPTPVPRPKGYGE